MTCRLHCRTKTQYLLCFIFADTAFLLGTADICSLITFDLLHTETLTRALRYSMMLNESS